MALPNAASMKENVEKISRPSLKATISDAVYSRGGSEVLDILPVGVSKGKSHDYNIKGKNPAGSSARDPRSRNRPATGLAQRVNVSLEPMELSRDAETPHIDTRSYDDTMSPRNANVADEASSFYEDFLSYAIHGTGAPLIPTGIDGHLDLLSGSYFGNAYDGSGAKVIASAKGQKVFATANSAPGGTPDNLEVGMVDDALSLIKGDRSNVRIMSDRATWVDFKRSLNLLGGNTTPILVEGVQRAAYDGCPWIVSDTVGGAKVSERGGSITSGSGTLTVGNTDSTADGVDSFIGFTDFDQGRTITVSGAGAGGADLVTTIASVTSQTVVELADNAATTSANAYVLAGETNGFYVVRFDKMQGFSAFVPEGDAVSTAKYDEKLGDYYGPVNGFDVMDLGISSQGGNIYVDRMIWQGNFCLFNPHSVVRYSGYGLANA